MYDVIKVQGHQDNCQIVISQHDNIGQFYRLPTDKGRSAVNWDRNKTLRQLQSQDMGTEWLINFWSVIWETTS